MDAGAPLRAQRVRALEPSKGAATQHRDRGHHRAVATDSHATVHATTMIDVGVVKHQGALETKCWSQEPKPKASAQNTVTRGKSASFEAFAHVSNL